VAEFIFCEFDTYDACADFNIAKTMCHVRYFKVYCDIVEAVGCIDDFGSESECPWELV